MNRFDSSEEKEPIIFECALCEDEMSVGEWAWELDGEKFCSSECVAKYMGANETIIKNDEIA